MRKLSRACVLWFGPLGLLGLSSVFGVLFGFPPWVFAMVYASIAGAILLAWLGK